MSELNRMVSLTDYFWTHPKPGAVRAAPPLSPGLLALSAALRQQAKTRRGPIKPKPERTAWKPLVRLNTEAEPSFTVSLSSRARGLIGDLAFSARGKHETGGALFGPPARSSSGTAEVWIAGEPGPGTQAWHSRMKVDLEHVRRQAGDLERSESAARWIGSWHSHPSGTGEPSDPDLEFFAADMREQALQGQPLDHYTGLILCPRTDVDRLTFERYASWVRPELHAWHVQQLGADEFTCHRAVVADGSESRWRI